MSFRHPHHKSSDVGFGRFAFNVTIAAIIFCLGAFAVMWYFADSDGKIRKPDFSVPLEEGPLGKIVPEKYRDMLKSKPKTGQGYLFYTEDGCTLTPVSVQFEHNESNVPARAQQLFGALERKQGGNAMRSTLPEGTVLKSVYLKDQTLIINLSREFADNMPAGLNAEVLAVYGVVNTMMLNIDTISAVRLLIEGESLPVARADVDISGDLIGNTAVLSGE